MSQGANHPRSGNGVPARESASTVPVKSAEGPRPLALLSISINEEIDHAVANREAELCRRLFQRERDAIVYRLGYGHSTIEREMVDELTAYMYSERWGGA